MTDGCIDADSLASLFPLDETEFHRTLTYGTQTVEIVCQSSETQHIQPVTGKLLWPGSDVLAHFIVTHPEIFHGRRVLELGSGCGLCGLLAAPHCSKVVMTEVDGVLGLLKRNVEQNPLPVPPEVRCLWWNVHVEEFRDSFSEPFEILMGSDLVYDPTYIVPLLRTVDVLLPHNAIARFILAYISRGNTEDRLMDAARAVDLVVEMVPLSSFLPSSHSFVDSPSVKLFVFRRSWEGE